jgi:transcriptional regulator with XRE-family HTH domain
VDREWKEQRGPDGLTFGERLRVVRKRAGLSQEAVASEVGKERGGTVGDWESGKQVPGADSVVGMARTLHVSAHWLLTGEGSQSPDPGEAEEKLAQIRKILDEPVSPPTEGDADDDGGGAVPGVPVEEVG